MSNIDSSAQSLNPVPAHVGIIMDGNRRWAAQRGLPHVEGHRQARQRVRELIEHAIKIGVPYMTLWAWSTKNWKRSTDFIEGMFGLARESLGMGGWFHDAIQLGVKFNHIGTLEGFPDDIVAKMQQFMSAEPAEQKIQINLAIGYEGRDELMRAFRKMLADSVTSADISVEKMSSYLDTAGQPDLDLLIRTGGEQRTSGFMTWQAADAEYYFTDILMPDFDVAEFSKAMDDYQHRERRLGGDSKRY